MDFITKFIPTSVSEENAKLEGSLDVRIPSIMERLEYMELAGVEVNKSGEVVLPENPMRGMGKIIALLDRHVTKVEMKRKDGSYEFTTLDELSKDAECSGVLFELAMKLVAGFNISKN